MKECGGMWWNFQKPSGFLENPMRYHTRIVVTQCDIMQYIMWLVQKSINSSNLEVAYPLPYFISTYDKWTDTRLTASSSQSSLNLTVTVSYFLLIVLLKSVNNSTTQVSTSTVQFQSIRRSHITGGTWRAKIWAVSQCHEWAWRKVRKCDKPHCGNFGLNLGSLSINV